MADTLAPVLDVRANWHAVLEETAHDRAPLERALLQHVVSCRWFRGKHRKSTALRLIGSLNLTDEGDGFRLLLVEVELAATTPERYALVVAAAPVPRESTIAELRLETAQGYEASYLVDVSEDPQVATLLLARAQEPATSVATAFQIQAGNLSGSEDWTGRAVRVLEGEQSNTSFVIAERVVLKVLRQVEIGQSVELEMLQHLAAAPFVSAPQLLGHLEWHFNSGARATLAVLQEFVENHGNAWQLAQDCLGQYYDRIEHERVSVPVAFAVSGSPLRHIHDLAPPLLGERAGPWLERLHHLGQCTGKMHLALAHAGSGAFAPESLDAPEFRERFSAALRRTLGMLEHNPSLPTNLVNAVLAQRDRLWSRVNALSDEQLSATCMRVHGDFHLGQVLCRDDDFVVIDFDGEPARTLAERRQKRSPLADVASMLRSFHYAAFAPFVSEMSIAADRSEQAALLKPWAQLWWHWTSACFLAGYVETVQSAKLLPEDPELCAAQLDLHLIEKALYEIEYELGHRPAWAKIPMLGLLAALA